MFQPIKSEKGIKIITIAKGMASMLLILVMFWFFTRLGLYISRYALSIMEWQKVNVGNISLLFIAITCLVRLQYAKQQFRSASFSH